ncbi:MAG: hypothetical protein AAFX53_19015, partial [Bacteroidota bacterium]
MATMKNQFAFLPLLVFYIIVVVVFYSDKMVGDDIRHLIYATNLTKGYYTDALNPEIGNGPGYPLVMVPLVLMRAPYIMYHLLNALFLYFAVSYFFKTMSLYVS